jgi:hypothetical protein
MSRLSFKSPHLWSKRASLPSTRQYLIASRAAAGAALEHAPNLNIPETDLIEVFIELLEPENVKSTTSCRVAGCAYVKLTKPGFGDKKMWED